MNNWQYKLNKALKVAATIEAGGIIERPHVETPTLVKHYTVYSIFGTQEKPIAWRLYAADVDGVIAAARRRLLRNMEEAVEHNPMFVLTRFEAREEI